MGGGDGHSTALECSAAKSAWKEDFTDICIDKCNVNSTVVKSRLILSQFWCGRWNKFRVNRLLSY